MEFFDDPTGRFMLSQRRILNRIALTSAMGSSVKYCPPFEKVSPALKACVGHEINGWGQWTHARSRRQLQEFRDELRRMQEGAVCEAVGARGHVVSSCTPSWARVTAVSRAARHP